MRHELLTALIKSLPKAIRRNFVPAPDVARMALESLEADYSPATDELLPSFALVLRRLRGVVVEPDAFDWESVPDHLKFTFQVRDARNKILGESKDIRELQQKLHAQIRSALADSLGASEDTVSKMAALAGGNSAQGYLIADRFGAAGRAGKQRRIGRKTRESRRSGRRLSRFYP